VPITLTTSLRTTVAAAVATTLSAALLAACSSGTSGHGAIAAPPSSLATTPPGITVPSTPASSPAPAQLPDPCRLLTRREAEQLVPVHMQAGDDTPATDPASDIGSCTYDAVFTGPSGHVDVFVQLGIPHALQVDRAIHHRFRTVAGIADQTVEEPDNESIFIRKGAVWVYVQVSDAGPAVLERAARLIAGRLS